MGRLEDWGTKSVCLRDEASDEKTAVIYTFHSGKSMDIIYNRKAHEQKHHHIMLRCEGKSIVSNLKSASGRLYQAVIRGGHKRSVTLVCSNPSETSLFHLRVIYISMQIKLKPSKPEKKDRVGGGQLCWTLRNSSER